MDKRIDEIIYRISDIFEDDKIDTELRDYITKQENIIKGLKEIVQNQSDLLEMYSKDNEVPNNAWLIKKLQEKDEEIEKLKNNNQLDKIADIVEEYINNRPNRGEKEFMLRSYPPKVYKMKIIPDEIRNKTELGIDYAGALIKMMTEELINRTKQENKAKHITVMLFSYWRETRNTLREHEKMYPNRLVEGYPDLLLKDLETLYKKAYKILKDNK